MKFEFDIFILLFYDIKLKINRVQFVLLEGDFIDLSKAGKF